VAAAKIPGFCFKKSERIKSGSEITKVLRHGSSWSTKGLKLVCLPNSGPQTRAIFITVKKYGNAVARNRARRVLSECWRLLKHTVKQGFDVVVLIYPGNDEYVHRCSCLHFLVKRSRLAVIQ
jgi:ribonuclease P protein component